MPWRNLEPHMADNKRIDRRRFVIGALQAAGLFVLAGCDNLSRSDWFTSLLGKAEGVTRRAQRLLTPRRAMAKEFTEADLSPVFPPNGTDNPANPVYQALARNGFADWRLEVGGLVQHPAVFSLAELRDMPSRTQITRHDCVEGWSAIGQWTGVPLSSVLSLAQLLPQARYIVFYCADQLEADADTYYESIDLMDAFHPQTILAYALNGKPLPVPNGAPLRLRVERQLGYKMAKYLMGIDAVE